MRLKIENLSNSRDTYINWPNKIKHIVDSYISKNASIPHATQKDGIQNCIDALNPRNKKDHKIVIRLVKIENTNCLIIEDYGTFGLTGDVLRKKDMERDLPLAQRWGRFENLAFNKDPSEKTLGARGQGKFMLLAASNKIRFTNKGAEINKENVPYMLYDTLRDDGVYRLGIRRVYRTESLIKAFEGDDAINELELQTGGDLAPLRHIGTRIVIPDIRSDLVKCIQKGDYAKMIGTTWFPLLQNNEGLIYIEKDGKREQVRADNRLLSIPNSDNSMTKVWKGKKSFKFNGKKRNISLFFAAHAEEDKIADSDIKGIGIYRSGMHVMNISHRQIPKEIMDRIYGYIEVDSVIEKELRIVEDPTHYHFDLSKGLPKRVRNFVENELMAFAKEKLGMHEFNERDRSKEESEARRSSLSMLNKLSKEIGLNGQGPGIPNGFDFTKNPKEEAFQIYMNKLRFPVAGIKRVNSDETLENIACRVVNQTNLSLKGRFTIFAKRLKKKVVIIQDEDIVIGAKERWYTPVHNLLISKKQFKTPGRCVMVYKFTPKDEELNVKIRRLPFWVDMNPNINGIFKDIIPGDFSGTRNEDMTGYAAQEGGDWVFYYNTAHNAYHSWGNPEKYLEDHIAAITPPWFAYIDMIENDFEERKLMTRKVERDEDVIWETCRTIGKLQSMLTGGS